MAMDRDEREVRRLLAANVLRFRAALGLTVETAAERGDLDRRQWQRVEAGEANATIRTLARLARALGVRVQSLFGEP
jgi:transcriptional regulator with XRE-family HTH domain